MMKTDSRERILSERVYSVLRPRAFKRKGSYFFCAQADVMILVQLQKSVSSTSESIRVTVNLGVFSKTVARKLGIAIEHPTFPDCHWKSRIGFLSSEKKDKWWEINSENDAQRVGDEIASLIASNGLSALGTVDSTEKLRDFWARGGYGGLSETEREDYFKAASSE